MKSFPVEGLDSIHKGLRKWGKSLTGSLNLVEAMNFRTTEEGLHEVPTYGSFAPEWLYANDFTFDFPYPKVVLGRTQAFFIYKNLFNFIDLTNLASVTTALTPITLKDVYTGTTSQAQIGNNWSFIDFFSTWMFVNGSSSVFFKEGQGYVENTIQINTGCEFQGRGILAGFNETNYYSQEWKNIWTSLGVTDDMSLGKNYVAWTSIGAEDLFWLFYPSQAIYGNTGVHTLDDSRLFELYTRGDIGYKILDTPGTIHKVLPLGDQVICYSDGGITSLKAIVAPIPTFGERYIDRVVIANSGAVASDMSSHVLVDRRGYVWRLTSGSKPERLGYREFLTGLDAEKITVSYNENELEFYISDGTRCFVLTKEGMTETNQMITSCFHYDDETIIVTNI